MQSWLICSYGGLHRTSRSESRRFPPGLCIDGASEMPRQAAADHRVGARNSKKNCTGARS